MWISKKNFEKAKRKAFNQGFASASREHREKNRHERLGRLELEVETLKEKVKKLDKGV